MKGRPRLFSSYEVVSAFTTAKTASISNAAVQGLSDAAVLSWTSPSIVSSSVVARPSKHKFRAATFDWPKIFRQKNVSWFKVLPCFITLGKMNEHFSLSYFMSWLRWQPFRKSPDVGVSWILKVLFTFINRKKLIFISWNEIKTNILASVCIIYF